MPDRVVSSSKLTAIANAIRTKAGTQASMTLDDMPTAIANIPGGSTIDLTGCDGQNWCASLAPRLDTSGMTDMSYMFYYQRTATSIDVSNFDTSNVTNMTRMFGACSALTSLDLGSFNTSQVTDMSNMFIDCHALTSITNLSRLTTSNVTTMAGMFSWMASNVATPVSLDLSTFRTSNVTTLLQMFYRANLQSLDLDNWDTSNVTTMQNLFLHAFDAGGKMWVPSTFVGTSISVSTYKPFYSDPGSQVHVFTNATSASAQGWGTIHSNYIMHYNTTHQDFLNSGDYTVTIVIPNSVDYSGGSLIQSVYGPIAAVTLSPKATYRINQPSGSSGITVTASGNDYIISGTPTANVTITCTTTQNADILTSSEKNFANWNASRPSASYGFLTTSGVSNSYIPWHVVPESYVYGKNEGYYYDLSSLPIGTSYQLSLTYKVAAQGSYSNAGCEVGISKSIVNDSIHLNMLGYITISGTQTEYITQTVNITRPSGANNCYLVLIHQWYDSQSTKYEGNIYVSEMTLRQI